MGQKIYLITGMSGAGKTYFGHWLMAEGFWNECVSTTTRPMRDGEIEGKHYYYADHDKFDAMHKNGEFAEIVVYGLNKYGITHAEIERVMKKGKDVFIIVENDGYKQIKAQYPKAIGIFLYATKEDCVQAMLSRGDSLENTLSRIATYEDEFKNRDQYDYVIKNVRNSDVETSHILKQIVKANGGAKGVTR